LYDTPSKKGPLFADYVHTNIQYTNDEEIKEEELQEGNKCYRFDWTLEIEN
jgi:hypothetical protein